MSDRAWAEREYTLALLILTAATGAIDGVSYLALDRVFTGNMTGNVLFIGFGLVGVEDIPVVNNLVALLTFMLGAVLASRIIRRGVDRAKVPTSSMVILIVGTVLVLALGGIWIAVGRIGTPVMIAITGLLALLLGAQAAVVKHIGIRDLSTVVVTMTMVNLSSDSRLAGGRGAAWFRRVAAIVTMGLGALASAAVTLHLGGAYALLLAGVIMAAGVGAMARARRLDARAVEPSVSTAP
jgi:uncharacterized membrane protein YoaK (UPF0700 family)